MPAPTVSCMSRLPLTDSLASNRKEWATPGNRPAIPAIRNTFNHIFFIPGPPLPFADRAEVFSGEPGEPEPRVVRRIRVVPQILTGPDHGLVADVPAGYEVVTDERVMVERPPELPDRDRVPFLDLPQTALGVVLVGRQGQVGVLVVVEDPPGHAVPHPLLHRRLHHPDPVEFVPPALVGQVLQLEDVVQFFAEVVHPEAVVRDVHLLLPDDLPVEPVGAAEEDPRRVERVLVLEPDLRGVIGVVRQAADPTLPGEVEEHLAVLVRVVADEDPLSGKSGRGVIPEVDA